MKRRFILALALALALGTAAIAEVADTTGDVEITASVEETETAPAEAAEDTEKAPAEVAPANDANALNEALKALQDARSATHTDELKAEMDEYVTAGKLTQEQADLILKHFQDHQAGKQDGVRGGKSRFGGGQRGQMDRIRGNNPQMPQQGQQPQMPGNGQQGQMSGNGQFGGQMPDANSGATPQMAQMGGNGQFGGKMPGNRR